MNRKAHRQCFKLGKTRQCWRLQLRILCGYIVPSLDLLCAKEITLLKVPCLSHNKTCTGTNYGIVLAASGCAYSYFCPCAEGVCVWWVGLFLQEHIHMWVALPCLEAGNTCQCHGFFFFFGASPACPPALASSLPFKSASPHKTSIHMPAYATTTSIRHALLLRVCAPPPKHISIHTYLPTCALKKSLQASTAVCP